GFLNGRRPDRVREVAAERDIADWSITPASSPGDSSSGDGMMHVARCCLEIEAVDERNVVRRADHIGIPLAEDSVRAEAPLDRKDRDRLAERDWVGEIAVIV